MRKILASSISNTWRCHSNGVSCNFVLETLFWKPCFECLADVIANVCLAIICCLSDVIAIYHFCGRCYTTRSIIWIYTFTIIKKNNRDSFLQHLNSIHFNIKFSCEEFREDGSMPFLDILITPKEDGSLKTSVFRKTTHTDLYLQWDSCHTIPSKNSVAGTLYHRASTVCSNPQLLQEEEEDLFKELKRCKYPT